MGPASRPDFLPSPLAERTQKNERSNKGRVGGSSIRGLAPHLPLLCHSRCKVSSRGARRQFWSSFFQTPRRRTEEKAIRIAAVALAHLSPRTGFAIRRREPNPCIDGICRPEPHQNPQRARNARSRHRRRHAVFMGKPSGRTDLRRHDRGRRRRDRGAAALHAADPDPDGAGAARHFAGLAGVAATAATYGRLSVDHRAAGAGDILLDIRQQHLSAARSWLGPDLGIAGGKPRRAVADHHARRSRRARMYRRSPWCRPCA